MSSIEKAFGSKKPKSKTENGAESKDKAPNYIEADPSELLAKYDQEIEPVKQTKSSSSPPSSASARNEEAPTLAQADTDKPILELDLEALEKEGLLVPSTTRSVLMEEYRAIKRPILRNAFGDGADILAHGNLVMVTSALAGEGKTFSSINLAMSIAMELERTVLLVDADVARPAVSKRLGLEKGLPGLMDVLSNPSTKLEDVIFRTNIDNFSLMPAGRLNAHATELLASEEMKRMVGELAERYPDRVIIFDSPPLLLTSEASVLASLMGQVVMVVEAARTPKHVVQDALKKIEDNEVVGLILNKASSATSGSYYGAYKYYEK